MKTSTQRCSGKDVFWNKGKLAQKKVQKTSKYINVGIQLDYKQ